MVGNRSPAVAGADPNLVHRMLRKLLTFVSLLSSSARSYLDTNKQRMLRPVSEVADTETRLGPAVWYVDLLFQHSRRHSVGVVRDLVKAGSVGFVGTAVEHIGLFLLPRRLGLKGSSLMFAQAREGLCHVEFQGTLEDAQNWFVSSADIKNAFRQIRIPGWLQAFFCTARCSRIRSWLHGKTIEQKRIAPDSLIYPVLATLPMCFFMDDVLLSRCRGPLYAHGKC